MPLKMYASPEVVAAPPCWCLSRGGNLQCKDSVASVCLLKKKKRLPDWFRLKASHYQGTLMASYCCFPRNPTNSLTTLGSWRALKGRRHGTSTNLDLSWAVPLIPNVKLLRVSCKATNIEKNKVKFSREELTSSQLEKWQEATCFLEGFGFTPEEADKILGKAFGWVYSPYWSEITVQTLPELEMISTKVDLMKEIGFSDIEIAAVLKKFPELLGCRETLARHNLGILDKNWGITGRTLKSVITRNPQVLGYSVDCKGDCMAQCTRCWVRF